MDRVNINELETRHSSILENQSTLAAPLKRYAEYTFLDQVDLFSCWDML